MYLENVYVNNLFIVNLFLSNTYFHLVEIKKKKKSPKSGTDKQRFTLR